ADRYVISTLLEPIRLELQLTDSGIAFLTGTALALFYVLFGFPLSWLIDRYSRRNIIAISVIAWSAMTTTCGLAQNYWHLLVSRIGVGVGEAGGTPGASSLLSDYFPAAQRPMALTVFALGASIGAWVGADVAGQLADTYGWRQVFLWLGIPGVLFGVLIFLTVREPKRGQLDLNKTEQSPSFGDTFKYLLQQRSAVHVMIASALTALWGWGLVWWTPTFLVRNFGLTAGEAGVLTGPMHLWGGSLATLFTAWLVARPSMIDPRRVVWLMGAVIGIATVVSWFIYTSDSLRNIELLFWIFIPSIYFYIGPCFGLLNNLAEPRMRAMFCAFTLFVANVGNLIIAPQLVGLLSDHYISTGMDNAHSLRTAMLWLVPTGLWATFHYFWSARQIVADQTRATGIDPIAEVRTP
ncbi:MAG: MFS transporter, partial [Gammaproteobacteria bacterium]|nr:MFS transporter [Gammaproteobacteria bacterium]